MTEGYARPAPVTSVDSMSVCRRAAMEINRRMVLWELLAVPGTAVLLTGLLTLSALVEQRILCPRAMILRVATARTSSPEFTESFVAREFERLLSGSR
jgi:hypothetical protein